MVKVAPQKVQQVTTVEHKQANTGFTGTKHPIHQPSMIAGTSKGLWIFGSEQRVELEGHGITALAPSPNGLWAVVDHASVWYRDLNGEWHVVASVEELGLNCILALDGTVLAGTSKAHLLRIADGNVEFIDSFDAAEERDEWYTPWGSPPAVRSLAVSQSGELYVNVHVGGILRSDNHGQSWQPTINIDSDVHEVRTVPDRPSLVLAATAEGLATSLDRGESWHFDRANLHANYSRAIAVCGEMVLISTSVGPSGSKAALYRRLLDEPGSFEKCERGLPEWFSDNINTRCLATSGDMTAFGTSDGQIFISDDAGLTWERIASGLAPIQCLSIV